LMGSHPFEWEIVYSKEWLNYQVVDLQWANFICIIGVEFDGRIGGCFCTHL
jgi:hypothetical protein